MRRAAIIALALARAAGRDAMAKQQAPRPQAAARPLPEPRRLPGLPRLRRSGQRSVGRRRVGLEPGHLCRAARSQLGRATSPTSSPTAATSFTPTSARRASTASPTRWSARSRSAPRSTSPPTATSPTTAPTGCRSRRPGRGRPELRRRPPRAHRRRGPLQALRALPRLPPQAPKPHWNADVGVIWDLRSRRAPSRGLHLRRRRRAADLPRPRPLRRGGRRATSTTRSG